MLLQHKKSFLLGCNKMIAQFELVEVKLRVIQKVLLPNKMRSIKGY